MIGYVNTKHCNHRSTLMFYSARRDLLLRPGRGEDIVMSMTVCVSVCPWVDESVWIFDE